MVAEGEGRTQPGELVTHAEAAAILGVHVITVTNMVRRGDLVPLLRAKARQLPRDQVEALAADRWSCWRTRSTYFITTEEAAELLGVSRTRVGQLTERGFLPVVETGRRAPARLYRRRQLEVIGNARRARWGYKK